MNDDTSTIDTSIDDTEGHGRRVLPIASPVVDTEGHGRYTPRTLARDADGRHGGWSSRTEAADTQGHGWKGPFETGTNADTQGHAARRPGLAVRPVNDPGGSQDFDVDGHGYKGP